MTSLHVTATPESLTRRVVELIDAGRPAAARPLMAAAQRLGRPSPHLTELSARLSIEEGRLPDALAELDRALEALPEAAGLRKCRAEVRLQLADYVGAAVDAAEAVVLDPTDVSAKALLGITMLELGKVNEARQCLAEALASWRRHPIIRIALAEAQERAGDAAAAGATLAQGIALLPLRPDLRRAAVLLCLRQQRVEEALQLAEAARDAGAIDATIIGLIAHCLTMLRRQTEAGEAYALALQLAPADTYVRHLAATYGHIQAPEVASIDYVRIVFDGYAARFEAHLIGLGYRVPSLLRTAVLRDLATRVPNDRMPITTLDLGCGTGLLGVMLADILGKTLVGVDASAKMLARAAAKQLYAELHHADLMNMLSDDPRRWRLVIAGDVFCYFGTLTPLLSRIAERLQPDGKCMFSVEILQEEDGAADGHAGGRGHANGDDPVAKALENGRARRGPGGWALQPTGRYAHTRAYVEQAAHEAGLVVYDIVDEILREEPDGPVAGLLVVLGLPALALPT